MSGALSYALEVWTTTDAGKILFSTARHAGRVATFKFTTNQHPHRPARYDSSPPSSLTTTLPQHK
jgi:hypothetical protein